MVMTLVVLFSEQNNIRKISLMEIVPTQLMVIRISVLLVTQCRQCRYSPNYEDPAKHTQSCKPDPACLLAWCIADA